MKKYRYKKSFKTKKKRVLLKNKFFWAGSLTLIVLGGFVYLFIFSSVFQIKEIQVSAAEAILAEEIRQIVSDNTKNIFLADFKNLNKIISEKYIKIASVSFKRKFPDGLIVQVEERKPVFLLSKNENYFLVDKEGVAFKQVSEIFPEMLVVKGEWKRPASRGFA